MLHKTAAFIKAHLCIFNVAVRGRKDRKKELLGVVTACYTHLKYPKTEKMRNLIMHDSKISSTSSDYMPHKQYLNGDDQCKKEFEHSKVFWYMQINYSKRMFKICLIWNFTSVSNTSQINTTFPEMFTDEVRFLNFIVYLKTMPLFWIPRKLNELPQMVEEISYVGE